MIFNIFITLLFCSALAEDVDPISNTTTSTATTTSTSTTTSSTVTTTSATTTTVAPTTAAPAKEYLYNVTENGVTCIMLSGTVFFKVTYSLAGNKTNVTTVSIPSPSAAVKVSGSCNDSTGSQFIQIVWGDSLPPSSITLRFSEYGDKQKNWNLTSFTSVIFMSKEDFINGTDDGNALTSTYNLESSPSEVPVNHSYRCRSSFSFRAVNTTMNDDVIYQHPVVLDASDFQLQAFNGKKNQNQFAEEVHCEADKIADIVPIAVGCALAALIVIVLIAYIIGRRRRSASYMSV